MKQPAFERDPLMKSETRDGMHVDWDVPIEMDDGLLLRADVFRPVAEGRYPVIMTHGPYAKGLSFQQGFKSMWDRMVAAHPDVPAGSSNKYQNWEVVDREKWVPDGYVCIRVDSRGAGRSPGAMDVWSPRETRDFFDCIEWAAAQPWSNGKVGLNGISYYAMNQWPLARTQWTKFFLEPAGKGLQREPPAAETNIAYETTGDGITFCTPPLDEPLEITGPVACKLFLSSATQDADVFVVLRVFDRDGKEVTFQGALDPRTPVGQGWLRASHRKLDPTLTKPYRPYHSHDEIQPLAPGAIYELDVEIWPTCIVVPRGYRVALTVRGKDYQFDGPPIVIPHAFYPFTGVGPFFHTHPQDRPAEIFETANTLHFGATRRPFLLLPVIPPK